MNKKFLLTVCVLVGLCAGCDIRSKEELQLIEEVKRQASAYPGSVNAIHPSYGWPLLHVAVLNNFPDLVEWLLDRKAYVNGTNSRGETPLHAAMIFDHTPNNKIVALLLKRGADVNARTPYGDTPLHTAVSLGHAAKARLLLSYGANVNARANAGETPLHYVCREGSEKIQNVVKERDLEESAKVLLQYHADIDVKDNYGATPLHGAVMVGNEDMVRFLIEQGVNVKVANHGGSPPLHYAAAFGRSREAEMLLAHGASASVINNEGMTPLDKALFRPVIIFKSSGSQPVDNSEVIEVLRSYGAKEGYFRTDPER